MSITINCRIVLYLWRKPNVIFIALRFMNFVALKLAAVTLITRTQMASLQFLVKGVSRYF